jgi:hypothetical protein
MRVLLLNDTRSENHVGCRLVVGNTLRQCDRAGLEVVGSVPHSATDDERQARVRAEQYDILLINGEGTMHHDQPKALALGGAAVAASRLGKCVVLFNTVWQANHRLNHYLAHFDLVFCRESLSWRELAAAGRRSHIVPDMVFATEFTSAGSPQYPGRTVLVDSVSREQTLQWAWRALLWKWALFPMHDANYFRLRRRPWLSLGLRLRSGCALRKPDDTFLQSLSQFACAVSGRFHGVCLAFVAGLPVVGIASNTHKIQGLFRDAGLDERAMVTAAEAHEISARLAYVRSQMPSVAKYVAAAPRRISQMFGAIRAACQEKAAA